MAVERDKAMEYAPTTGHEAAATTEKLVAGPLRGALDKKAEEWLEVCGKIMAGTGAAKPDAEDLSYADALRHCAAEVMSILALASLPSSPPPPLDLSEEEIAGIRRGLADVAAGRVKSLEQIETDLALPSSPPAQDACICGDDEHSPECALAAASPVQGVQAYPLCENCGKWRDVCICSAAGQRAEGAEAGGHWLIYFADIDHAAELFVGPSAEKAARARFKEASLNWDCTLFRKEARL